MKTEEDIAKVFSEIELELIDNLKRHIKTHSKDVVTEGFDWTMWQTEQLYQLTLFNKEYKKRYPEYFKKINNEIKDIIRESYILGLNDQDRIILKAILKGATVSPSKTNKKRLEKVIGSTTKQKAKKLIQQTSFFVPNKRALNSLLDESMTGIITGEQSILRKMDDVYRDIIFKSQVYSQSGSKTLYQCVDMAAKDFLDAGINNIIYKNGAHVNIQSYAEMSVRTARKQAYMKGEAQARDEWGINTVQVSQYGACSNVCLPYQGKVYVDNIYSSYKPTEIPKYPLLSDAIAGGLFHPNCRHTMSTFFEGINEEYMPMNTTEIYENSKLEEKQRYMERNIRKYKRLELGSLDTENKKRYGQLKEKWENQLHKLVKDNKQLRYDEWRTSNQEIERLLSAGL